ncbi:unnamed protein product [Nezara viridula]|uniref:Uncharacterized protein n=1 Tax=Nezara viridula TaxID=85310 RepID=A0A9P0HQ99_NEZVI|nr:unnamed protein product [Nezara viridula]
MSHAAGVRVRRGRNRVFVRQEDDKRLKARPRLRTGQYNRSSHGHYATCNVEAGSFLKLGERRRARHLRSVGKLVQATLTERRLAGRPFFFRDQPTSAEMLKRDSVEAYASMQHFLLQPRDISFEGLLVGAAGDFNLSALAGGAAG